MEGENSYTYLNQRVVQVNLEYRYRIDISHKKSKYLNRMDEALGSICSLISPDLLFHISSCKTPNEAWTTLEGLFGK
jgi:hypothetical protein